MYQYKYIPVDTGGGFLWRDKFFEKFGQDI